MAKSVKNKADSRLRIIPIGGLGEVGKNTWVFDLNDEWIIIDAGLGFPFNEYPGVELIYPDIDLIVKNQEKIKALVITHAHEDHIGGAVRLLSTVNVPEVYASNLTIALLEAKMKELAIQPETKYNKVGPRQVVQIGGFLIEFIRSTHSVPDCFALLIKTPEGNIFHSGDFKFDFTPVDGEHFDIPRMIELREEGIKLLISDSTNVEREGFSLSEKTVGPNLLRIFKKAPKRIFITTFSSHVHRIQQVLNTAREVGRKVTFVGPSMELFFKIASETDYLSYPTDLVIPLSEALNLPEEKVIIITTGSQGETNSALAKMSRSEHRLLKVVPGDTIVFSANPIPGNERSVSKLLDRLAALGAELVYGRSENIHVSGHGAREELRMMLALTRPEHFLPAHGDYRMLVQHAELGAAMGINSDNIYILENGDILESVDGGFKVKENQVTAPPVYYDSMNGGIVDPVTLKDRMLMGQEGLILAYIIFEQNLESLISIDVEFKGVTFVSDFNEDKSLSRIKEDITASYERMHKYGTADLSNLRMISRDLILKNISNQLYCKPLVMVFAKEITNNGK